MACKQHACLLKVKQARGLWFGPSTALASTILASQDCCSSLHHSFMVLAARTLRILRQGDCSLRYPVSAVQGPVPSQPVTSARQRISGCHTPDEGHSTPSKFQLRTSTRARSLITACAQSSDQQSIETSTENMANDVQCPVDVAHSRALLEFINAAWTPYHAVGEPSLIPQEVTTMSLHHLLCL